MRVAVVGVGGVGGYFGGLLARAHTDVHFLSRGAQLAALREKGLRITGSRPMEPIAVSVTDDPEAIGPCDVVLLCTKAYDTDAATRLLPPLLHEDTAVVSLQNGVDNEERLVDRIGEEHVMGGAAFVFAFVADPGVIHDGGGPGSLVFGELNGAVSARGEQLLALCARAGIPAELVTDVRARLWEKFAFICAQAGLTACTRLPIGEIRAVPEAWTMFQRVVHEVVALSLAEGVDLPSDTAKRITAFAETLPSGSFSSLYVDLEAGRRLEVEALHGLVVRRAREHGLSTPMCEATYALLKPHAVQTE
jgi:2-dehydropantoate 2-reductase